VSTKQTKRHVRILLVTGKEYRVESVIARYLRDKAGDRYDFEFVTAFKAGEILELSQTYEFDMFFLFLNNIPFHLDNNPFHMENLSTFGNRLNRALQLVNHLKTTYRKPVIAVSGIADLEEEEVKRAGVDFYFLMPATEDLFEAMIICLDRLS